MTPARTCETCGATMRSRSRQWVCSACFALAEAAFDRERPRSTDPVTWGRERYRLFGDRNELVATIQAERLAVA